MSDKECWLGLQSVLYAKPLLANALLQRFETPERILRASQDELAASDAEWQTLSDLRDAVAWEVVTAAEKYCTDEGLQILCSTDPHYPPLLAQCPDHPILLFVQGDPASLHQGRLIAIVGARKATGYGKAMAAQLATGLAAAGVTVVSGLALGIDGEAHRATLAADGKTIGILGGGHQQFYPPAHRQLAAAMRTHGAVVSEFLPTAVPYPSHFPQRNRIISGLSIAVVVVEAAEQSGTLSTARHAAEQGRIVFAVPGPAGHVMTRGTHGLLRHGAQFAECAQDILEIITPLCEARPDPGCTEPCHLPDNNGMAGALLAWLAEPRMLDCIAQRVGRSAGEVLAWLAEMECAGHIRALPGNRYVAR